MDLLPMVSIVLAAISMPQDAAVERFLAAREPRARAAAELIASDADFERAYALLRAGRRYGTDVPRGRILRTRTGTDGLVHPYRILVP